MRTPFLLASAALVLLAGCSTLAPDYERPAAPIPSAWPSGPAYKAEVDGRAGVVTGDTDWRAVFPDPALQRLIELAIANNRDLRVAALNIERARAQYQIQRAPLFPQIDATAGASMQRVPQDLSTTGQAYIARQYSVGLAATSYELDFFGRIRSLKDQALEQYLATGEARRSAQLSLVATVANAYLQLAADRESLAVATDTLQSRQASLDLAQRKFDNGLSTELDLNQARSSVDGARADIALYAAQVAEDANALSYAVGAPLSPDMLPAQSLENVAVSPEVAAGLPSEMLSRRPDIRQAEHLLLSANANIGAARARFFPSITLTSTAGLANAELNSLFKAGSWTWTFAPQIDLPIFDAGSRRANLQMAETDRDIYVAQYEKAIQGAFREVADALAVRGTIDERIDARSAQEKAAATTYRLSEMRFREGLDSFLVVLDSQRSLYEVRQALITVRLAKLTNVVNLYKALGGGWSEPASGQPAADGAPEMAISDAVSVTY